MIDLVRDFISEREPVDQEAIEDEFGRRGLDCVMKLVSRSEVSYDLEWRLVTET